MASFRISGLTKSYGSNVIVDDLDLEIEEGEFLVLLGPPSGCGKTTTLRCLAGLETPEQGRIEFKGKASSTRQSGSTCRRTSAASAWCSSRMHCGPT